MTVGTAKPSAEYIEDGVTVLHAVPFQFFDPDELIVTRIDGNSDVNNHVLTLGVDYTVAGGAGEDGSITKSSGGIVGATLRIQRHTRRSQLLDYQPRDDFPAESHEEGLDRLEMQIQELEDVSLTAEDVRDIIGKTLVAGNGIKIVVNDQQNTITISAIAANELIDGLPDCVMLSGDQQTWDGTTGSGSGGLSEEDVMDIVAGMIRAGAGIKVDYDDAANTYTITNSAPAVTGLDAENVMDIVAAMLTAGDGIELDYDDPGNKLTITNKVTAPAGPGTPLAVTDQSLVGNNGHMTLSNGLIVQWGVVNVPANGMPKVYFPIPYAVWAVPVGSGGKRSVDAPGNCRITAVANTNFEITNSDGDSAHPFWWISIGV
jgi:hypothetical protein